MNQLGQWSDFGQVVPYLQKNKAFKNKDFDNFPIKAYLVYTNPDQAHEYQDEITSEENIARNLHYADPATGLCWSWCVKVLIVMAIDFIVFVIFLFIYSKIHKKNVIHVGKLSCTGEK